MAGTGAPIDGPECGTAECREPAGFWLFHVPADEWRPLCPRHLREVHPSVEIRAWLESGYAKPAELGRPESPPSAPAGGRARGFRSLVDDALDWDDTGGNRAP